MIKSRKIAAALVLIIFTAFTTFGLLPSSVSAKTIAVPKLALAAKLNSQYNLGSSIILQTKTLNYRGKVQYRVVLENMATKTTKELWTSTSDNYSKPYYAGTARFLIGWPNIKEAGTYRVFVYVKRAGLKGRSDSYVVTGNFVIAAPQAKLDKIGILLSNGTRINAVKSGTDEYIVDASGIAAGTGIKFSITPSESYKLIPGGEYADAQLSVQIKAHSTLDIGPSFFGLPDNNPPGFAVDTLRNLFSDSDGYVTMSFTLINGSGQKLPLVFKVKVDSGVNVIQVQ